MRIKKALSIFFYSPLEIFAVFAAFLFLLAAEWRIRTSKSETLLSKLNHPPHSFSGQFLWKPLQGLKKTRLVSLVEAVDKNLGWKPSCLRRTFALAGLLRNQGLSPTLKIGVHRTGEALEAHSWFELDGLRLEMQDAGPFSDLIPLQEIAK